MLGVNTNTVLRSLRVLRDEGLLEFRRGRGILVAGTPERGAVVQRARELVDFARSQGYRLDEPSRSSKTSASRPSKGKGHSCTLAHSSALSQEISPPSGHARSARPMVPVDRLTDDQAWVSECARSAAERNAW